MKNVVIVSMLGTGALVIADDIKNKGGIHGTHLLGLGIVYIGITAANDFAPKVAVPLALLVFAAVALAKGPKLIDAFGTIGSSSANLPGYASNPSTLVPGSSGNGVVIAPKKPVRSTGPSGIRSSYPSGGIIP